MRVRSNVAQVEVRVLILATNLLKLIYYFISCWLGIVTALAHLLSEQDPSKNHFAGVYSELYRRFGVSSYKNIRQERYAEVLEFLEDWRSRVAGSAEL